MPELIESKIIPEENEDEKVSEKSEVSLEEKERVEEMMEKGKKKDYEEVIGMISDWDIKEQKPIINQILEKKLNEYDYEDIKVESLFKSMCDWSPEESCPIVEKILQHKKIVGNDGNYIKTEIPKENYFHIANAMSDWSEKEIKELLDDEKNTEWPERILSRGGYANEQEMIRKGLIKFKLYILEERNAPITDEMVDWIKNGLKSKEEFHILYDIKLTNFRRNNEMTIDIIEKHPELFEELAPDMFLSGEKRTINYVTDKIQEMDVEEQYKYSNAMTNGFSGLYNKNDTLREIIAQWDCSHKTEFIRNLLAKGGEENEKPVISSFFLLKSYESITDPEIIKAIIRHSINASDYNYLSELAENLIPKIKGSKRIETLRKDAVENTIAMKFSNFLKKVGNSKDILDISKKYEIGSLSEYKDKLPIYTQSIIENWNLNDIEEVAIFFKKNQDYVLYLSKNPDQPCSLTPEDLPEISKLHLKSLLEAEQIKSKGLNFSEIKTEDDYQKMFEILKETNENWQDEQNISNPFENGAKTFGYEKMFKFIDRKGLTRHDGLHAFESILELCKSSGLTPEQFYGQILYQVKKDDSEYEEWTAHHHLNAIALSLDIDFSSAQEIVKKYPDIPELQELTNLLSKPEKIFSSWNDLKRYSDLTHFLEQTEILDELEELAKTGNKDLYNYIKTLAFHKYSKVDMGAVMQFWRDPYNFFAESASHTPEEIHNSKKPSNYIEIPNLDLYAEELRDALVEGKIDKIQAFSGLEIKYQIPLEDEDETEKEDIRDLIKKSLGSRKEGLKGTAKNSKKLFNNLKELFKKQELNLQKYLDGEDLSETKAEDLERQIENLIYDSKFGIKKPKTRSQSFIAKIQLKSDPEGALAGNDTVNCMPFGDGKNTVYTFNPNTVLFTIQMKGDENTNRTITQSVLTKDKDINVSIPKVIEKMNSADADLSEIIPQNVVTEDKSYIACDNIEVAPRYSDERYQKIIENIYRDFFQEYIKRFAKEQNFHSDKAVIGMGYTDALTYLPQEKNTFAPLAPVSYSDKTGEQVYVLDLLKKTEEGKFLKRTVAVNQPKEKFENPKLPNVSGIEYLTFQDALSVAFLESKAYKDNQSLIQNLHNMENGLIAKDINNAAKGRSNMSFKYTDSKGQIRGYIFAYEGKLGENENEEYNYDDDRENIEKYPEDLKNQRVLYISDLASDREQKGTGLNLLKGFFQSYKQNYTDKNDLIPIYFEAREKTSYQFIQKGLSNLLKKLGIEDIDFQIQEFSAYKEGDDIMHPMIIRPIKKR